jgi:hypothetical protein
MHVACSGRKSINYYFTDNEMDGGNPPSLKRGRVAANTVAELLLQLRADVCEHVGWTAKQCDSDRRP